MMHHTQRLATANGRHAFECGEDIDASNPYRRRSKSYDSFRGAWLVAQEQSRIKVARFIKSNASALIVSGEIQGRASGGAVYILENGDTFDLTALECQQIEPRWSLGT